MAADLHVAGAGFREERAFGTLQMNAAAARGGFDVVGRLELGANVAGAGFKQDAAAEAGSFDGTGTGVGLERTAEVLEAEIAGAGVGLELRCLWAR